MQQSLTLLRRLWVDRSSLALRAAAYSGLQHSVGAGNVTSAAAGAVCGALAAATPSPPLQLPPPERALTNWSS